MVSIVRVEVPIVATSSDLDLVEKLRRFLARREYEPGTVVLVGPKRFAREVLDRQGDSYVGDRDATEVFSLMRRTYRALAYDDAAESMDRHVLFDAGRRKWAIEVDWRRRWYIVARPYRHLGLHRPRDEDESDDESDPL